MSLSGLKGMGLFQLQIIHLISIGIRETISNIEKHLKDNDLIDYLYNKYQSNFIVKFDNSIYDNKTLNSYFYDFTSVIEGNESRKYGIKNEDDGLLLILAMISDAIEYSTC